MFCIGTWVESPRRFAALAGETVILLAFLFAIALAMASGEGESKPIFGCTFGNS
jgi:hypothetical protein